MLSIEKVVFSLGNPALIILPGYRVWVLFTKSSVRGRQCVKGRWMAKIKYSVVEFE